jgi:hypothetical protein
LNEATRTPCCHTAYCEDCINSHLLEHDFVCPSCESKIASLDKLEPDEDLRERAKAYREGEKGKGEEEEKVSHNERAASRASEADSRTVTRHQPASRTCMARTHSAAHCQT